MCLNRVNYHSIGMTDFFLLLTPTPLFLKLVISSPAAVSPVMFEEPVNEDMGAV